MSHVEADECCLANACATDHDFVDCIAKNGCVGGKVGTYRDSPDGDLIPRQQIAGETQKECDKELQHTNHPVNLSGRLVRSVVEDTYHMQRNRDDHQVGGPTMHITNQQAE